MKFKIFILALLLGLEGCATGRVDITHPNLTDSEKQAIKEGNLIKPESIVTFETNKPIEVSQSGKTFICVTGDYSGGEANSCYTHLGERVASYFEKAGIRTTQNRLEAQNAINVSFGFGYVPTYDVNKTVMETAESSLAEDNTFVHIKLTSDEEVAQAKASAIGTGVGAVVSVLLGVATGNQAALSALNSTNPQTIPLGGKSETKQDITIMMISVLKSRGSMHKVSMRYVGPADPTKTFPVLFDEAMNKAASKIAQN